MFQLFALALAAVTLVFVLFNLFKGLIRGFKKTIGSLVAIVISAVIALIVTVIVCAPNSSLMVGLMDFLKNSVTPEGGISNLFAITELSDALLHYATMIVSPFFFVVAYVLISIIVSIIVGIVVRFIPPRGKAKGAAQRLGGLGVGVVCGIVVSLIMVMPVVGVLNVAATVTNEVLVDENGQPIEGMEEVVEIFADHDDSPLWNVYNTCCGWAFDLLASTNFEGERIYLKDDVSAVVGIISGVGELGEDMTTLSEKQIDSMHTMIDGLDKSVLLRHTLAGVISDMSGKWLSGESFLGMEKISAGEMLDPLVDSMLGVMATSTRDTVTADLRTMTDIFGILVKNDLLSGDGDLQAMLQKLGNQGVITDLIVTANKNERMSTLSDEITQLSIRALGNTLGLPENADQRYDMLMDDVSDIIINSASMSDSERIDYVSNELAESFEHYGVEVDDDAIKLVAEGLVGDFGSEVSLDGSDVQEFFMVYAASASSSEAYSKGGKTYQNMSDGADKIVVNTDGTISVGDRVLENYNAANYGTSLAYTMASSGLNIGDAVSLYSAASMKSSLITLQDICDHLKKYSDCEDPEAEAEKISKVLVSAADLFADKDLENMTYDQIIGEMGSLLDEMNDTEIFGSGTVEKMLKAMLQSDMIRGELGLSMSEVNAFSDKLNGTVNDDYKYSDATNTVSNTINMISSVNDSNKTEEEKKENTKALMENMTPESAEILSTMVTPSVMVNYGAPESKADVVSDSVSAMFTNMANYNADSGSENYEHEANAVNQVLTLVMNGASDEGDGEGSLFKTEDQEGRVDTTAEEFIDLVVTSEVVSQTIIETVEKDSNNPFAINSSEADKESISTALEQYYADNANGENNAELAERLNAIAVITNVDFAVGE